MDWILLLSTLVPMITLGVFTLLVIGILWRIFKKLK